MKLEEMKRIAAARTPGRFHEWHYATLREIPVEQQQKNNQFLAMAANNWDYVFELANNCSFALNQLKKEQEANQKLRAVAEAAKSCRWSCECPDLIDALEALEATDGK